LVFEPPAEDGDEFLQVFVVNGQQIDRWVLHCNRVIWTGVFECALKIADWHFIIHFDLSTQFVDIALSLPLIISLLLQQMHVLFLLQGIGSLLHQARPDITANPFHIPPLLENIVAASFDGPAESTITNAADLIFIVD